MKKEKLIFKVISSNGNIPNNASEQVFLMTDNWNDWHIFRTMYQLFYVDAKQVQQRIGRVKIGQISMRDDQDRPELVTEFEALDDRFFSLGQDEDYYENLNQLDTDIRDSILIGLRDIAKNLDLLNLAKDEKVFNLALLRDISLSTVKGQFHRMSTGGARLTAYDFEYTSPKSNEQEPLSFQFRVKPESNPPTNLHVLIGRNGVGKTHLLKNMTRGLIERDQPDKFGKFNKVTSDSIWQSNSENDDSLPFFNLVSVTFSAFDNFKLYSREELQENDIRYAYIGLKKTSTGQDNQALRNKDITELSDEFSESLYECRRNPKADRWRKALSVLETDPVFMEAGVSSLIDYKANSDDEFKSYTAKFFDKKLSSGHKLVLLIMTRLIETVEEKTLVLMDEPEAHLHPPLLSAFVRALSDLMVNRNGVAIIATHSPVVLQEVPKSCVWKLRRTGEIANAEQPEIETFGENIGILTREIFGYQVTEAGFHKLVEDAVEQLQDFDSIVDRFDDQLGSEALAIARGLMANKDSEGVVH